MTAVGYVTKVISLTIDDVEYQCEITGGSLDPSSQEVTWQTACPDGNGTDFGPTSWVLNLTVAQDWTTADSLVGVLNANVDRVAAFKFAPAGDPATGVEYAGDCRLVAVKVGGDVGALASSPVALPVLGQPVPTYPVIP